MAITICANNLVSLDNIHVGRIDRDSYHTIFGARGKTTFFTASTDRLTSGYDTPHEIDVPVYVAGPADWRINPDFEASVREIVGLAE